MTKTKDAPMSSLHVIWMLQILLHEVRQLDPWMQASLLVAGFGMAVIATVVKAR
jgi:hypothetical protein